LRPDVPPKIHSCSRASPTPCETGASPSAQDENHAIHHPTSSASRATLSSEVTEPFCRLPLHTLCPKLEAMDLEHLLRFVERLDWKLTLSLQFSRGTKKAGGRKKGFLLFKRKEADLRIILIHRSFKGQWTRSREAANPTLLFTFLNRKDISAAASCSRLGVLLCCHKQIPRDARVAPHAESSTGILTGFPFAEPRNLTRAPCETPNPSLFQSI